jgi:hypothetical protein
MARAKVVAHLAAVGRSDGVPGAPLAGCSEPRAHCRSVQARLDQGACFAEAYADESTFGKMVVRELWLTSRSRVLFEATFDAHGGFHAKAVDAASGDYIFVQTRRIPLVYVKGGAVELVEGRDYERVPGGDKEIRKLQRIYEARLAGMAREQLVYAEGKPIEANGIGSRRSGRVQREEE